MDSLFQRLLDKARSMDEEEFVRSVKQPALLLRFVDDDTDFVTKVRHSTLELSGKKSGEGGEEQETAIRLVAKSDRNPYSDRISIGRAASCDIVVRHPSVSKLHAHFLNIEGGWLGVRDASSRNGVWLNGERVSSTQPHRLEADDEVLFGAVEARFVYPVGLYRRLRAFK